MRWLPFNDGKVAWSDPFLLADGKTLAKRIYVVAADGSCKWYLTPKDAAKVVGHALAKQPTMAKAITACETDATATISAAPKK